MPEYITKASAQLITNLSDSLIRSTAVRACVASVLHQRYFSVRWTERVVVVVIDWTIELAA